MSDAATISMKRLKLHDVALRVYGGAWVARLSAHRGVQLRTVQRWSNGEKEVPDEVLADLHRLAAEVEASDVILDIEEAAMHAVEQGLEPALVAGILESIAANLRMKPINLSQKYRDFHDRPSE